MQLRPRTSPNPIFDVEQTAALQRLKASVAKSSSGSILEDVEFLEKEGLMTEGSFIWTAAALAVETQEDVPRHVAVWAIDDAIANVKRRPPRSELRVISANITSWRKDLCTWIAQQNPSICMLQETHVSPEQPDLIESQLGWYGYNVFCLSAHPTGKGGTSGGLAICFKKHLNMRQVHHFSPEGAGFLVAALRLQDVDCYFVNLYLRSGEGFQGSTNSLILSNLIPFLQSVRGLFFVAGDFNEDS